MPNILTRHNTTTSMNHRRMLAAGTAFAVLASLAFGSLPAHAAEPIPDAAGADGSAVVEHAPVTEAEVPAAPAPVSAPPVVPPAASASPVGMPAPEASAVSATSVDVVWTPTASAGLDLGDYEMVVYLGEASEPSGRHALDADALAADASATPIDEGLEAGEVGVTVSGLAAQTGYQFSLAAAGGEAESERTETVTTPAEPEQPEEQAAAASSDAGARSLGARSFTAAAVSATAPTATVKGGSAVLLDWAAYAAIAGAGSAYPYYTITVYADDSETVVKTQMVLQASSVVITGLTPGASYSFDVRETNDGGSAGRSTVVTTRAEVAAPGVIPAVPTAEVLSSSVIKVSWPAVDSGAEVRSYTVKAYLDGTVVSTKAGLDPFVNGTSWDFIGLLASTEYTFAVTAVGYDLTGDESGHSAPIRTDKGVPTQPARPTLTRTGSAGTGITASWTPPTNDGGYPISGYRLEFYNSGGSTATAGLVQVVEVTDDQSSYRYDDFFIVGSTISVRIFAINAAGSSPASAHSTNLTVAATATPVTPVTPGSIVLETPTTDGFTLKWNAPTAAVTSDTGYMARIVEFLPSNGAASSNYTYALRDLGTGWGTSGQQSTQITGLDGGRTYQVAITAYQEGAEGDRQYRSSSARSTGVTGKITTLGSTVPAKPMSKAATPEALGIDSVRWTGAALPASYQGGSELIGYRINLYRAGSHAPVQSVEVPVVGAADPAHTFTGLDRGTLYQVRYAGVNANGAGALSDISDGVSTLLKALPGTVAPEYSTLAQLLDAIDAREITEITAASIGILTAIESNSPLAFTTSWTGDALDGELWLYPADGAAEFQDVFRIPGGTAVVDTLLGDLETGTYYLAMFTEADKPVAVELDITRPITGPTELEDAVFRWGINNESNNGAFFGGCNFFTAGKAPSSGAASPFQQWQYAAEGSGADANVRIEKPNAAGEYRQANWSTKCLTRTGAPVTNSVTTAFTESQVVITGGAGTVDPSTNSAAIQWTGSFTVAYYGGMTFWYATDPKLVVENGVGTVTVTASGYGTDMFDQSKWVELAPREITIASLSNVRLTSQGITVIPDFLGVAVEVDGGAHSPQVAPSSANAAFWGSFPVDFLDFQAETGQLAYWYSSGGSQDRAKPTLPLYIGYDAARFENPDAGEGGGSGESALPPLAIDRPAVQQQQPLRAPLASGITTSVDSMDALRDLIDKGTVGTVAAADAGVPAKFAVGDRLDFDFAWPGSDTRGVIWLYPEVSYAGSFAVVDGRVTISLDSSVLDGPGEKYFAFFGDLGTVIAIGSVADGYAETVVLEAEAVPESPLALAELIPSPAQNPLAVQLLVLLVAGLAVIALSAGGGAVLVLRRRGGLIG